MTTLTINGQDVDVSDNFLSLSDEDKQRTVQEIASSLPKQKPKPMGGADWRAGLAGQVAQGLTLGFADEAIAGLYAGLGVNDYQENLRRIRGLDKRFVDENPVTAFAANVAGGLPIGGAVAKGGNALLSTFAPKAAAAATSGGASVGQRIMAAGATGAGAGAVAGFGSGEGGIENRAASAGLGSAFGGLLGSAIPAATSAASGLGNAALNAAPFLRDINIAGLRPFTSSNERASQIIGQAMARGGDQGAAEAALSGAVRSQIAKPPGGQVPDTVLGDVSPELRSLTGVVLRSPGAGAAKAREFIATRQEGVPLANVPGQGSRLAGEVSGVGGRANLRDTLDTIVEERSAAAKPLFEKAFQVGDVVNPTLTSVAQDGAIQRALAKGVILGKRAGDIPPDFKLALKDASQPIPARVWHYAKTALDDQIATLRQAGRGAEARSALILKSNLINGLDEATGGAYRPALADFAGRSALLDAAEQGQKAIAANIGPDDIQRAMAGFQTQGERDLFSQAYKSALANQVANSSRSANAANKVILSDQQVAKIRAAFPSDQAEEIIRRASVRDAQFRTYAETRGSQTQSRLAAEQDIEASIQNGVNFVGAAADPKGFAIGRAMNWLSTMPSRMMSERVRDALAKQLVDPNPKRVAAALKAIEAAAARSLKQTKTVTGNRQLMGQIAGQTAANNTLSSGASGLGEMYTDAWDKGDTLDRVAMGIAPVPLVGDAASVLNDTRHYVSGKLPLTWENMALTGLGATALGVGAFAPKSMVMPDKNSFGMFGGNLAAKANKPALEAAKKAIEEGAPAEAVWKGSGWYQGVDGKWRFEIDDSAAKLNVPKDAAPDGFHKLSDVLDHKQLFDNYPALRNMRVVFDNDMDIGHLGSFNSATGEITLNAKMPVNEQLSTILHEIQHSIQSAEGFASGGNPTVALINTPEDIKTRLFTDGLPYEVAQEFKDEANQSLKAALARGMTEAQWAADNPGFAEARKAKPQGFPGGLGDEAYKRYAAIPGEVEARNTQKRIGMTARQRAESFPDSTMDTPRSEQFALPDDIMPRAGSREVTVSKYAETLKALPDGTGFVKGPNGKAFIHIEGGEFPRARIAVAAGEVRDTETYRNLAQLYAAERGIRIPWHEVRVGSVYTKGADAGVDKKSQFSKLIAAERRRAIATRAAIVGLPAGSALNSIWNLPDVRSGPSRKEPPQAKPPARAFSQLNMAGAYK